MISLQRLLLIAFTPAVILYGASCSSQKKTYVTREIRRPAPGGGYTTEQIRIEVQQTAGDKKKKGEEPVDDGSFWNGDGVPGEPSMCISLQEQKVFFMKDGQIVGMSPISSGRESHSTRPGKFRITEKDIDHKSNLYGDYVDADGAILKKEVAVRKDRKPPGAIFDGANMRYFMRINGPIGMHEGYLPGYPASHGCIRLPTKMAEIFFNECSAGTPVEIVP
ncbi:L,D-transpeptidase-like protein [Prosthecobacter fusiformis]|uniref:L,D-transpeptidase-like protein n=1 Tax=Prosthecobacter fusiformis TaxID=48464 RepID=A0A4R7SS13_9BACT|nr:L,D-transpeptidase family protein [Prosthecobacter fusiformis]TDU81266.1 L,D-transpeptidase-like protein [Prosthecobacter fusiformis]